MTTTEPRRRARSLEELDDLLARSGGWELAKASIAGFVARPTDVVITPYGKSGTTWTQQIFHTLRTRGDMAFDDISRVVPWIETAGMLDIDINAEQVTNPRGFKSHLDYERVPKGARYINVIRNPVDRAFSSFKFMEGWYFEPGSIGADEYITSILSRSTRGCEEHLVSWWPHRNDPDVLYLVFEHMKHDLQGTIEKIAEFVGIELDDELLAITLEHASLPFMKRNADRFDDAMMRARSEATLLPAGSDSAKVRAGLVGVHDLSDETVAAIHERWATIVEPVTGFASYQELIDSLA